MCAHERNTDTHTGTPTLADLLLPVPVPFHRVVQTLRCKQCARTCAVWNFEHILGDAVLPPPSQPSSPPSSLAVSGGGTGEGKAPKAITLSPDVGVLTLKADGSTTPSSSSLSASAATASSSSSHWAVRVQPQSSTTATATTTPSSTHDAVLTARQAGARAMANGPRFGPGAAGVGAALFGLNFMFNPAALAQAKQQGV